MKTLLVNHRQSMAEALHGLLVVAALAISFLLRFDYELNAHNRELLLRALPLVLVSKLAVFRLFELQHLAWRYLGFADLVKMGAANAAATFTSAVLVWLVFGTAFPRSVFAIDLLVWFTLVAVARAAIKWFFDRRKHAATQRVLIYGAGKAGLTLLSEIRGSKAGNLEVAGFLDDDRTKLKMQIHGVRVLGGRQELALMVRKFGVTQILIALPQVSGNRLTEILEACHAAGVEALRVPGLSELIQNRVLVNQIRQVRLEDLLGRAPVQLREEEIEISLTGRVVLVTGAGGSIGSELCRQIARYRPAAIVGLDQAETPLFHVEQELLATNPELCFRPEVGSIQTRRRLEEVFRVHQPEVVFHAAAYKHVPMMEAHLFEAVENNVFGTANVVRCAIAAGVQNFVLISSDKAVRSTNIMGASKRMAEMVCLGANSGRTRFIAVRFGNVLGSNGSVIPRFQQQIACGGPVTVTHPEMRRFFMTIPEAAQLVLQAAAMGNGGEIFVLDMGEPIRIVDLARKMVLLSGLRPDVDIRIVYSGVRPGEKLYEEVCASEEDTVPTPHSQIRIFSGPRTSEKELHRLLRELRRAADARDPAGILMCLKDAVHDYNPSSSILRQALEERPERARKVFA